MIKPILFSTAVFLLVSCGSNTTPPAEVTPAPTEVIPEKVDGPAVVQDTLPKEEIPAAEEKVVEKEKDNKAATVPAKNNEAKTVTKPSKPTLHGSWTLDKVYGAKEPFNMLFPNKIPDITFDLKENRLNGNNGCNSYNGPFELKNGVLKIGDMISTRMYCEGVKESLFMTTLKMANTYKMEDNNLVLMLDNDDLMRFKPQK